MKTLEFQNQEALEVYRDYISRVRKTVAGLSAAAQADILAEFNSHIYEGLSQQKSDDEYSTMIGLTEMLGNPEIVLIPLVAEKQLSSSVEQLETSNWVAGLVSKVSAASLYLLLGLLYLFIFILVFMSIAKVFLPEKVGFWYSVSGFEGFWLNHSPSIDSNIKEALHFWLIPFNSVICYALYLLIGFIQTKKDNPLNN